MLPTLLAQARQINLTINNEPNSPEEVGRDVLLLTGDKLKADEAQAEFLLHLSRQGKK
jgi:hypothetical protein